MEPASGLAVGVSVSVRVRTAPQVPRRWLGTLPRKVPSPQPQVMEREYRGSLFASANAKT